MCGIIGYTGSKSAREVILDGLKALEYRGYDSAGMALNGENLCVVKRAGRVSALEEAVPMSNSTSGIGHTRWATHGEAAEQNAHPHISPNGKIAVVHNGIIENCDELKSDLLKTGAVFKSDTDSEILAHLMQNILYADGFYGQKATGVLSFDVKNGDSSFDKSASETKEKMILRAIEEIANRINGATTFLMMFANDERIFCHRQGAALIVAEGDDGTYAASDMLALSGSKRAAILSDGETAVLSKDGFKVYFKGDMIQKNYQPVCVAAPVCCMCHMKKEINEIPAALESTYLSFKKNFNLSCAQIMAKSKKIAVFACGTAYHASLYAKEIFETKIGIPTEVYVASEADGARFLDKDCFCVFITQSGETADTLAALRRCKTAGCQTLAITNVRGSTITYETDFTLYLDAGAEIAVAATKSYNCQMLAVYLLANAAAKTEVPPTDIRKLISACKAVTSKINIAPGAERRKLYFIGKGIDKINAQEGALKFKEITYLMTDAYPAGELKHGTIALIDDNSTVVVIATDSNNKERLKSSIRELKARGAEVSAITAVGDIGADYTLYLPPQNDSALQPIVSVIPLQILSLNASCALKINPDKPRNLAKSVTVV